MRTKERGKVFPGQWKTERMVNVKRNGEQEQMEEERVDGVEALVIAGGRHCVRQHGKLLRAWSPVCLSQHTHTHTHTSLSFPRANAEPRFPQAVWDNWRNGLRENELF
ncbi:unnamed protein product [Leuciscus chuanchicus]